ncbi:MAG: indolepyruvate oxidoreductase subunit beta [Acidobacteria bacterium]|nr:indolepyruvate oxidoreductase subunit beta [Acidobacteriota bacterium]
MSKSDRTRNLFLSGVGGQGTILASNILGQVLLNAGYDVKKAEVHGMAQRGGDVTTHFRFGKKVYSPLIRQGEVDYLISFELLEALRYINWVRRGGTVILNRHTIFPPSVSMGKMEYPKNVELTFRQHFKENVSVIDGNGIARSLGNIQVANVVLIGAVSNFFPELKPQQWIDAVKDLLPARLHEINLKAFEAGRSAIAD